ncbi:MAG: PQQ-binding-like beta-propeller repeat protein [Pseudomonadales bacterium]|nr:PQQ-binding-like beta-propeller repeat protein [Pseudomonadales bacterium]
MIKKTLFAIISLFCVVSPFSNSQILDYESVTDEMLQNPSAEQWLSWRGTPRSWGYSPLDQIDTDNVGQLQLVWSWALDDTGAGQAAPLVRDGVMFVPGPRGVVQALDAATGDLFWEYRPGITPSIDGTDREITAEELSDAAMAATAFAGVGRGVQKNLAIYGDMVFYATENASIRGLDARTGRLVWETQTADPALGYYYTAGPIVANGVLVTGITGCGRYKDGNCYFTGHDPQTGAELWRFETVAAPGTPGGDTWGDLPLHFRAGGDSWQAGSYDPDLNLVIMGTSQAKPWARAVRGTDGDALYTNSTIALNPSTGEMNWYYQHLPGETHDMDENFETVLIDIDGRDSLFKMGKLGILWQLDRESGEIIRATDVGYQTIVNVNPVNGNISYRDGMIPRIGQQIDMCPSTSGFKSWRAMAYSPQTEAMYIPITLNCELATFGPTEQVLGGGGPGPVRRINYPHHDADENLGELLVMNIPDGDIKWRYRQRAPINTAALTTGGGLVFIGDWNRYYYAFDAETGDKLWQTRVTTSAQGFPMSYMIDGKQYIAMPVGVGGASWSGMLPRDLAPELVSPRNGNSIHVFALPD